MSFNPQLPFLATLELPDVSKLTNDPILHNPYWPPVPTKIPGDCPNLMVKLMKIHKPMSWLITFGAHPIHGLMIPFGCVFFKGLSPALPLSGISNSIADPFRILTPWLWHFSLIFSCPFDVKRVHTSSHPWDKRRLRISLIISMNGDGVDVWSNFGSQTNWLLIGLRLRSCLQ